MRICYFIIHNYKYFDDFARHLKYETYIDIKTKCKIMALRIESFFYNPRDINNEYIGYLSDVLSLFKGI